VTLGGLTNGQQHSVQWWASDATLDFGSVTTATGVIDVSLDLNTTHAAGGVGQYAVGTFTASGTSQTFDLNGSGGWVGWPLIMSLQVRTSGPSPTPIPEVDSGLAGGAAAFARSGDDPAGHDPGGHRGAGRNPAIAFHGGWRSGALGGVRGA
jgi:hypothetical protein